MPVSPAPSLLGTKKYGVFWFASLLSNTGTWMQSVAEPWLILSINGSSFLLGLDAFAMNAPFWVLALLGGVMADRGDKGRIIFLFQGVQMLCPMIIVGLVYTGRIDVSVIIMLSLIVGITDALSMPAFQTLIPSIVHKEDLGRAVALNSLQFNLSRVLGPAIAGIVMMKFGPMWCFTANAASYIPFFLSVYWLVPMIRPRGARQNPSAPAGIRQSIRDTISRPENKWALLSVLATSFFCGPLITFTPVIVKEMLHADAGGFGGVMTAFGIGGLLGPLPLLLLGKRPPSAGIMVGAAMLYAGLIAGVPQANSIWMLAAMLVGGGFLMTVANTMANTYLQSKATDGNRGQASSFYMLAMRGGLSIGNFCTGLVAGATDVRHALLLNGLIGFLVQIFIATRFARDVGRHDKTARK